MSRRWKLVGSACLVFASVTLLLGNNHVALGDSGSSPSQTTADESPPGFGAPYAFGPGAFAYSDADTTTKADVDRVRQRTEASQGELSYAAFSAAAGQAASDAQAQIAARQVGLVGVDEQGVVP